MSVRDGWRATVGPDSRDDERECWRRKRRKAERRQGGREVDLRGDRASRLLLVVNNRPRTRRDDRLMTREVRVERLPVMMARVHIVQVDVHHGRCDRAGLHEDDEDGGGQPAMHTGIVVNEHRGGT